MAPRISYRRALRVLAALALLGASAAACRALDAPERITAYVPMPDGTRLAVDVYLPGDRGARDASDARAAQDATVVGAAEPRVAAEGGDAPRAAAPPRVPAVVRMTAAWRDLAMRDRPGLESPRSFEARTFTAAGYALVLVDARGSGASEGARVGPADGQDAADFGALADWITAQPWSDGRLAAWGDGDDAAFAERAAAAGHPALRAAILRFGVTDYFAELTHPDGAPDAELLEALGAQAAFLAAGDPCAYADDERDCDEVALIFSGPRPVGDDQAAARGLAELLAARLAAGRWTARGATWYDAAARVRSPDAPLRPEVAPEVTLAGASTARLWPGLRAAGVPIQAWAGWLDGATADAALARLAARPAQHEVIVGALARRGTAAADPLGALAGPPDPPVTAQFARMIAFLDRHLRGAGAEAAGDGAAPGPGGPSGAAHYAVAGTGAWRAAAAWPPEAARRRFHLGPPARAEAAGGPPTGAPLGLRDAPPGVAGEARAALTAAPGLAARGRWMTRIGRTLIYRPPGLDEPSALTFDSAPLAKGLVLAGRPRVAARVAVPPGAGRLHVYLAVVGPDGAARLIDDRGVALDGAADGDGPAWRDVSLTLWSVAAAIPAGSRLRLVLVAGGAVDGAAAAPGATWRAAWGPGAPGELTLPVLADAP